MDRVPCEPLRGRRRGDDIMGCPPPVPGGQLCLVANVHVAGEVFLIASRLRAPSSTPCTGDGNAMTLRADLPLEDMEFAGRRK